MNQQNDNTLIGYRIVADASPGYVYRVMDFKGYELKKTLEECARLAQNTAADLRRAARKRNENPDVIRVVELH